MIGAWILGWGACVPAPEPPEPPSEPFLADWQGLAAFEAQLAWWGTQPGVTWESWGSSAEGRPLWALRIRGPDTPEQAPMALVTGLQHAREWIAGAAAMHIAERLIEGPDPQAREVLMGWEVVVVPVVNPDGYRYSWTTDRLWRKNRQPHQSGLVGVDLNRNWAEGWGEAGSSGVPASDNYRGEGAFSAPETAALMAQIEAEPRFALHLDLHSPGQLVLYPWGYTGEPSAEEAALSQRAGAAVAAMEAVDGQPFDAGSFHERLYPGAGVAIDWTHARGLESYLFELRDRGQYGFMLADELRRPGAEEAWAGFVALALE